MINILSKCLLSEAESHRLDSHQMCHFLILLFFSFSPTIFAEQKHWQSSEYIINSFIDVALNNEYSTEKNTVRKWTQPIYYTITHRTGDQVLHQQLTELHLAQLADITGIKISPALSMEQTNLNIIFSTEQQLGQELEHDFLLDNKKQISELTRHSVCLAYFSVFPDNSIKRAIVIIPVDRARAHAKLLSCVVEELTQIMGLPNDSDKVYPSIFNDKSHDDYLSGLDYVLLRLLYHPNIKAGMTTAKVKSALRKIIAQDEFQWLVDNAEQLAHQQGLYQLLN